MSTVTHEDIATAFDIPLALLDDTTTTYAVAHEIAAHERAEYIARLEAQITQAGQRHH